MPWLNHDGRIILHHSDAAEEPRFTFDRKKLEQKMALDSNPSCFLLQPLALRRRFREATDTLVAAIRRFDFSLYSPLLSNLFGPDCSRNQLVDRRSHDWMRS